MVDQTGTIGALPVAVSQAAGIAVGYLPGLATRCIAEATRTMPLALRSMEVADEQVAELSILCGFDDDLAKQVTASSHRIRSLLPQFLPALERVIGPHLCHQAMPEPLPKYPTPATLRRAGHARVKSIPEAHSPDVPTGRRRHHRG